MYPTPFAACASAAVARCARQRLSSHAQRPPLATAEEMTRFHADDYVNFLKIITPDNMSEYARQLQRCACGALATRALMRPGRRPSHSGPRQSMWGMTAPCLMVCSTFAASTRAAR